jgi:hypothetical protein
MGTLTVSEARSYLDIYDRYGLMRERAMFAHCIWLNDEDRARMAPPDPPSPYARHRICFWAAAYLIFNEQAQTSRCRWRPTSAAAPRFLCCKR